MMAPVPLRSAMTVGCKEDTSLALPSDDKLRSGHQRVLDQVHSIKRGKSKQGKSGSPTLSPTDTSLQTSTASSEFGTFKFSPSKANGSFSRNASTKTSAYSKGINSQRSRSLYTKSMGGRQFGTSGAGEQQINTSMLFQSSNGLKPSRSDPLLAAQFGAASGTLVAKGQTAQNQQSFTSRLNRQSTVSVTNSNQLTNSQTRMVQPPSVHSYTDGRMATMKISKADMQQSAANSGMSIEDAVEMLSHQNETNQQCGASTIQHISYSEDSAKEEVSRLGGIPPLVSLLRSPNPNVSQAAAAALRNLVYGHQKNKLEVQHCDGIAKALQLLKETTSTETEKQITGLLWNLSSDDSLKTELTTTAMPALTENVLVPFTAWSENTINNNIHPDVFFNATGCLRNLSHSTEKARKKMRACPGLIDSLVSYMQSCVAEDNPDDKSMENCTCILHNLTYQLDTESPECIYRSQSQSPKKSPPIGCFSPRSSKVQKEFLFDSSKVMPREEKATGGKLLCHLNTIDTYMSLLGSSKNSGTMEACCGALQNLTASKDMGSISQYLNNQGAVMQLPSLLRSNNLKLQKSALSLMNNMSRTSSLQAPIVKTILPELGKLLLAGPQEMGNNDDTAAMVCSSAQNLMLSNTQISKKIINRDMVTSLTSLTMDGRFPKTMKAAAVLLYNIWNDRTLQGAVKKMGMTKAAFINNVTSEIQSSLTDNK